MNDPFFTEYSLDRRRALRFDVTFPAIFEWTTRDKSIKGAGVTRNVSLSGLLLLTDAPLPVNSNVRIDVDFETKMGRGALLGLHVIGTVVRHERCGELTGMAVKSIRHKLSSLPPKKAKPNGIAKDLVA